MKRYLLSLLLLPAVAAADDNHCPICTCTLIQRDQTWADTHDAWWSTYHQIQRQIIEYAHCVGALNELERSLGRPLTPANQVILNYEQGIQHPLEAFPNDNIFASFELDAAGVTLGQFYGEVLACSAGVDQLRIIAAQKAAQKCKKRK